MKLDITDIAAAVLVLMAILVSAWSAHTKPNGGGERDRLARDLVRTVIPEDTFVAVTVRGMSPHEQEAFAAQFDYSRMIAPIAKVYATTFDSRELREMTAFYKAETAQVFLAVSDRFGAFPKPRPKPKSPPDDTRATRVAAAVSLAELTIKKEYLLQGAQLASIDLPAERRNSIVSQLEVAFSDPTKVHALRLAFAKRCVPVMTTSQLREVLAFYSSPTGEKLLRNTGRIGQAFHDAAVQERQRIASVAENAADAQEVVGESNR